MKAICENCKQRPPARVYVYRSGLTQDVCDGCHDVLDWFIRNRETLHQEDLWLEMVRRGLVPQKVGILPPTS